MIFSMRFKLFAATVFVLISVIGRAQQTQFPKYKIGLSPALISSPTVSTGFQPSVEIRLNNRVALLTEFTFLLKSYDADSSAFNRKYFKIKQELKYFFNKNPSASVAYYAGLQLAYSFRSFDATSIKYSYSYYDKNLPDSCYFSYSSAHIKSPIFTTTLQLGLESKISKRLSLDMFGGMGLRVVNTSYSDVINRQYKTDFIQWRTCSPLGSIRPAYQFIGTNYRFQMNIGFRLFYAL